MSNAHPQPSGAKAKSLHAEMTQCQNCWKSKGGGVTLKACKGCGIELYCSKECQVAAWPKHKQKCKLNRALAEDKGDAAAKALKTLRDFTGKHRATLAQAAISSFDLRHDVTRSTRDVFFVVLEERPGATRSEKAFIVKEAGPVPATDLSIPSLQEQMQLIHEQQRTVGKLGSVFVVLMCPGNGACNICPVGFDKDVYTLRPKDTANWKKTMMRFINAGIAT